MASEIGDFPECDDPKDSKSPGALPDVRQSRLSAITICDEEPAPAVTYRVYRRRWLGLVGLALLNCVAAMNWILFTTISTQTAEYFNISLTKVNWLSNIVGALYLVVSWVTPAIIERGSIRTVGLGGAAFLGLGVWLRYAAACVPGVQSRYVPSSYALLFLGSCCIGVAQSMLQIVGPSFSETWFSIRARTTATMVVAVANPFGGAVGDILAPAIVPSPANGDEVKTLTLVVAIITSIASLVAFGVGSRPPSPPSLSASRRRENLFQACKALLGFSRAERGAAGLTPRSRLDFAIIFCVFSVLVASFSAYSTLINQIYAPAGYDSNATGYFGAAAILSGLVGAGATSPIFDRYLTHHFALAAKALVPVVAVIYLGYIWAVRPSDEGPIYLLNVVQGVCSFILLPLALELAAEVTSPVMSPDSSSAVLYLGANGLSVVMIVVMNALRDGPEADPPFGMKRALIFQGVLAMSVSMLISGLRGEQTRRKADESAMRVREAD